MILPNYHLERVFYEQIKSTLELRFMRTLQSIVDLRLW